MEARRAVRRIAVVIAVYLAVSVALGIFIAEPHCIPGAVLSPAEISYTLMIWQLHFAPNSLTQRSPSMMEHPFAVGCSVRNNPMVMPSFFFTDLVTIASA